MHAVHVAPGVASIYTTCMARAQDHLAALLELPLEDRAKAARTLLDSLDEGSDDAADDAQVAELIRRVQALDAGDVALVAGADARSRGQARLALLRRQRSRRTRSSPH